MGKRAEEGEALRSTKIRNSSPRFRRVSYRISLLWFQSHCCCRQRLASNRAGRSEAGGGRRAAARRCVPGQAWVGALAAFRAPAYCPSAPLHVQHGVQRGTLHLPAHTRRRPGPPGSPLARPRGPVARSGEQYHYRRGTGTTSDTPGMSNGSATSTNPPLCTIYM